MGWNTVAVLYNDQTERMPEDVRKAVIMANADYRSDTWRSFNYGQVICSAHADVSQVVVIGQNGGELAAKARNLDWYAIDQMKQALENHGYKVVKRKKS